jgi:hypothetical protein
LDAGLTARIFDADLRSRRITCTQLTPAIGIAITCVVFDSDFVGGSSILVDEVFGLVLVRVTVPWHFVADLVGGVVEDAVDFVGTMGAFDAHDTLIWVIDTRRD